MFSLIAVVCQGVVCTSFSPPVVYASERLCMEGAVILYNIVQEYPSKTLVNMKCYEWSDQA